MSYDDTLKRLYIEPSSHCNLRCAMCFRNSWIDEIPGNMSEATFKHILEHLPETVETVFFGGMGEPLVHAHITDMIRAVSATGRRTELLSNGMLLDEQRAAALLDAGLDMLWLSVDALDDTSYGSIRCNGDLEQIKAHMTLFNRLRFRLERPVRLGLAFVVMKSNVRDLAKLPGFAQYYHINEVNISHMIPTDEQAAGEILYRQVVSSDLGGNALPSTVPRIHVPLMDWMQPDVAYGAAGLFSAGMCELFLSGQRILRPARHCRFIDEGMAFVRHDGMLSPCMSLLRSSYLYWGGRQRVIQHHFFGNVKEQPLTELWNSQDYRDFRKRVREFEFSPCCRCSQCDNWEQNLPDCYGNEAPTCGACLWSEGIVSCP